MICASVVKGCFLTAWVTLLLEYSETCVFRTPWLKCPDYQGVLVSLHVNGYFGTITKCPDYGGVLRVPFYTRAYQGIQYCVMRPKKTGHV